MKVTYEFDSDTDSYALEYYTASPELYDFYILIKQFRDQLLSDIKHKDEPLHMSFQLIADKINEAIVDSGVHI